MRPFADHGRKLDILNSVKECPLLTHVWIAVRARDKEFDHALSLGYSVRRAMNSARRVQNEILQIAGSDEKAAVNLPARLIGNPQ